jgi:hypothetical protein
MNSLTSSSFNQCLNSIQPCEGVDDIAHRVFLTAHEGKQEKTLNTLAKQPLVGNTMIGVSGFFILNAAAVRGSVCPTATGELENIILIDRSVRVEHFWNKMQGIMADSTDRYSVIHKVVTLLANETDRYFQGPGNTGNTSPSKFFVGCTMNLMEEIKSGVSWLSSDMKFDKIKKIFDNGRFIFKRADLCYPDTFKKIGQILKKEGATVDTVYLSNTSEYMLIESQGTPQMKSGYITALEQLIASKTLVVHTEPRGCIECHPLEQCIQRRNGSKVADFFPALPPLQCQQHYPK